MSFVDASIACGAPRAFVQYVGAPGGVYGLPFRSDVRLVSKTASRNSIVPFVGTEFHTSDHEPFAQAGRIGRCSLPLVAATQSWCGHRRYWLVRSSGSASGL